MTNFANFDDNELLALADWHFQNDQHEGALDKLKVLLGRGSAPLQTYALLGRLYATIGLFGKAKEAFRFYLDNESDESRTVNETFQLGLVERDMGNTDGAIQIWDNLLQKHPNHSPALYNKALVLSELGQTQAAVELLNHILETAPDNDNHIQMADQLLTRLALQ
jgi:tetratricopeptide (TPR) repeat protein